MNKADNTEFIQEQKTQKSIEIDGYTITLTFQNTKTMQKCFENILATHMYSNEEAHIV